MNNDGMKFVDFSYCKTCRHESKSESEEPCNFCLSEPVNYESHKPTKWEEK